MSLSDLTRSAGISKATAHRLLAAMEISGYVMRQGRPPRFALGIKAFALARGFLDQVHMYDRALELLRELRDCSKETAALAVRSGDSRVFVAQVQSPLPVRHAVDIGVPMPLSGGATGKAILSFLSAADVQRMLANVTRRRRGARSMSGLRRELATIREQGFALSEQEVIPGTAAVAAPVLGPDDQAIGAVSVTGPFPRFDETRRRMLAPRVVAAANALSRYQLADAPQVAHA